MSLKRMPGTGKSGTSRIMEARSITASSAKDLGRISARILSELRLPERTASGSGDDGGDHADRAPHREAKRRPNQGGHRSGLSASQGRPARADNGLHGANSPLKLLRRRNLN